jgi:hypothetical protein
MLMFFYKLGQTLHSLTFRRKKTLSFGTDVVVAKNMQHLFGNNLWTNT